MRLVAVVAMMAAVCAAQEPAPIRVEVSLVNVGFSVRDAGGKLVTNLTQDDFEITEDGVPQKVSFFARSVDVPLTLGLVMDMSGSQHSFIKPHLKALQEFLKTVVTPRDKAFVMSFANNLRLVSDYSEDAKYHVSALEQFGKSKDVSDYPMIGPKERRILGTAFYDAIYYGSTQMMQKVERGRRALIVFSDGEDNSSAHHMLDAIEAAQTNDVLLYTIRYTEVSRGGPNARNKYGTGVMERIARETGGLNFDGQGEGLLEGFRQIGEELRSAYEIAYHTSNPAGDRTFHKIAIRPKREGLVVRAKTGYFAR